MPRMIVCPRCAKIGPLVDTDGRPVCGLCADTGTARDRRAPTANDRAVERIKAIAELDGVVYRGTVEQIIREEQEDGYHE